MCTYVNNHADCWQSGCQVLRVRRPDVHWNTASVETAVKGCNQIYAWKKKTRRIRTALCKNQKGENIADHTQILFEHEHKVGGRTYQVDRAARHSPRCWCCLSPWALQRSSQLACEAEHRLPCRLLHPDEQDRILDKERENATKQPHRVSRNQKWFKSCVQKDQIGTFALRRT